MKSYKSIYNYFWYLLILFIIISLVINIKDIISFKTLFLIVVPNWISTFILLKLEIKNIKNKCYELFKTDINNLFNNQEMENDENVALLKENYNKMVSLFVYVSSISIMSFLLSSVFIMMKYIKAVNYSTL